MQIRILFNVSYNFYRAQRGSSKIAGKDNHNMMMMNAPVDRYQYLLEKKPELLQKIPLTHLASYIGITRETLSRIRGNKY